jgi:hypothetical protein
MHRSGTSALTRMLSLSGADLPRNLIAGDASNPRGYFESWRTVALNTARLNAVGSAWDDPFAFPNRPWPAVKEGVWRDQVRAMLEADYDLGHASPLIKDPRLSILLPAWVPALRDLSLEVRCVIAVRHPLAVAASLARRDRFTSQKSVLVWINYMLGAALHSRGLPCVFVSYDALLADWRAQAARVEAAVGAPSPASSAGAAAELDRFLTPALRRHAGSGELRALGWIGEMAGEIYAWLCAAVEDRPAAPTVLERAAAVLAAERRKWGAVVSPISRDLDAARMEVYRLAARLAEPPGERRDLP